MSAAEVPRHPDDPELRKIIDKLAQFVAKNGPEFEQMTKQKQKDNPKFGFLFGGDHFHYYQYKVTAEQALTKQQKQPGEGPSGQIANLEKQLLESERNLKAQWEVLCQQKQSQIDSAIEKTEHEKVTQLAAGSDMDLTDFAILLEALSSSCTKEAISKGKQWIFSNCSSDVHKEIILLYILQSMRKKQEGNQKLLEKYVGAMYSFAMTKAIMENSGGSDKLEKLLSLWQTQKYFSESVFPQMQNYRETVTGMKNASLAEHANLVAEITQNVQTTFAQYQQQHNEFSRHVTQQLTALKTAQQIASAIQQTQSPAAAPAAAPKRKSRFDQPSKPPAPDTPPIVPTQQPSTPVVASDTTYGGGNFGGPPPRPQPPAGFPPHPPTMPPMWPNAPAPFVGPPYGGPGPPFPPYGPGGGPGLWGPTPPQAPWGGSAPVPLPGMMPMPPPGPGGPPRPMMPGMGNEPNLIPTVAYYDLPAGLMVPLVKLEDSGYKPLDPSNLRLPPPMPPSERLLAAMENFYSPPSHDNPRDSDGWERLGLYEYFKQKAKAAEKAAQEYDPHEIVRRRDDRLSESERDRENEPQYEERERERSPPPRREERKRSRSRTRSGSASSSRSRSRSKSESPSESRSGSRSESRSATESPPGFTSAPRLEVVKPSLALPNPENKGTEMMKKMGWSGAGLGVDEQGRTSPVSGGEVREKSEQYRGVGVGPDPFEAFRRQKAGHYVQRIRQAHKEREIIATTGKSKKGGAEDEERSEEYDY